MKRERKNRLPNWRKSKSARLRFCERCARGWYKKERKTLGRKKCARCGTPRRKEKK